MTGQNTILFLFNQNDIIERDDSNKLTFLFGEVNNSPIANCKPPKKINYETNHIAFNCACDPINYNNNHVIIKCETKLICPDVFWKEEDEPGNVSFNIDCNNDDILWKQQEEVGNASFNINCECVEEDDDDTGKIVFLENIRQYFGHYALTTFSIDLSNINYYYGYSGSFSLIAADMRFSEKYYFGVELLNQFTIIRQLSGTYYFGALLNNQIIFDPRNPIFVNPEDHFSLYHGSTITYKVVFDPYHEFFESKTDYADFRFGFEQKNTKFVYDPYNLYFKDPEDSAQYYFGFTPQNTKFVYDPYNEFFDFGETGTFGFGFEQKNPQFVYNPYNRIDVVPSLYFGYESKSYIRYADDPYFIEGRDIFFPMGYSSVVEFKFANVFYSISSNVSWGFSGSNNLQKSPGFIGKNYFGYNGKLKYITIGQEYTIFNNCYAAFGFELHDNQQKTRYLDLSANQCCTKVPYEMLHIEMTDNDGWDIQYGLDKGWGIAMTVEFSTLPRFSATLPVGYNSRVEDNSVYLGTSIAHVGISVNVRGIYCESNMHMSYGNFIIDQNEIKVEITKPLDVAESNYSMYMGSQFIGAIGVPYHLGSIYTYHYTYYSYGDLRIQEALRSQFYFGYYGSMILNVRPILIPNTWYIGFYSRCAFYEPPIYMYAGFETTCSALITENWVEFLEEGELNNEYVIQNQNGDPDLDRPQGESIEGYRYQRYIKGRCY